MKEDNEITAILTNKLKMKRKATKFNTQKKTKWCGNLQPNSGALIFN